MVDHGPDGTVNYSDDMFSAQNEGYDEIVDTVKEQCSVMSDPDRSDDVEFSPYLRIRLEVLEPGEHLPTSCSPEDTSKAVLEMREFDPELRWTPVLVPRSERIKQLKAFKAKKGHCKVPRCYPDNPSLVRWVDMQRELQDDKGGQGQQVATDGRGSVGARRSGLSVEGRFCSCHSYSCRPSREKPSHSCSYRPSREKPNRSYAHLECQVRPAGLH